MCFKQKFMLENKLVVIIGNTNINISNKRFNLLLF